MDLSQQIESEHRRLQERSQIAHLQGQVDELRNLLDQQSARAQLAIEQARQSQGLFSQLEARFEAQIGEARLQEQTRLRASQSLQKEIAELRSRLEEPARQIITLLAQVQDLQEGLRLLREEAARKSDEGRRMEQKLEEIRAQGLLREERLARLDNLLAHLQEAEEERQQAVRQVREELSAERQNLRRQAADIERLAADLRGETQDLLSRLNRLTELQRQSNTAIEATEERFDGLQQHIDHLVTDLKRIEQVSLGNFLQGQERLESLRQSVQREWRELREAEERRGESQNAWLRRIEELYHALDERLARRDAEMSTAVTSLEDRVEASEKSEEDTLRSLIHFLQERLEQGATTLPGESQSGEE